MAEREFDTILYMDVLEHIEDAAAEFARAACSSRSSSCSGKPRSGGSPRRERERVHPSRRGATFTRSSEPRFSDD